MVAAQDFLSRSQLELVFTIKMQIERILSCEQAVTALCELHSCALFTVKVKDNTKYIRKDVMAAVDCDVLSQFCDGICVLEDEYSFSLVFVDFADESRDVVPSEGVLSVETLSALYRAVAEGHQDKESNIIWLEKQLLCESTVGDVVRFAAHWHDVEIVDVLSQLINYGKEEICMETVP